MEVMEEVLVLIKLIMKCADVLRGSEAISNLEVIGASHSKR